MSTFGSSTRGASHDKLQQAAQQAGIADVFKRTAAQAAPLLTLQQSLLGGIVRSQQQEARRLARRDGDYNGPADKDGSARQQQARARTAQLQALLADAVGKAQLVTRLADSLTTPGTFAGYVHGEDGAAAADHTVTLHITRKEKGPEGREWQASAKTDADGYFRMVWAQEASGTAPAPTDAAALASRLLNALAGEQANPQTNPRPVPPAATDAAPPPQTPSVRVLVSNPQGALVLEDPTPPTFETQSSAFRCYVVASASNDHARGGGR